MNFPWLRVLFLVGWLASAGRRSAYHLWPHVGLEVVNALVVIAKVVEHAALLLAVMVMLARLVLRFRRRS
ncbi:hypothetical protein [Ralstonia pseudosolanacearum]|uniref:Transmembrane protein n=1 Tax=Ralstonia solanacearum TaxID=305 RepID=A0AA92EBJ6_RALSL|nr:hypothetical protein [Ralstonia pseudosolanacearum]QCX48952.1 hypothetical protein E7Z57_07420 [Ralstonia pseudosolanacearum]